MDPMCRLFVVKAFRYSDVVCSQSEVILDRRQAIFVNTTNDS